MIGGGAVLIAMLVGALQFDPSVMAIAVTAVLGGIVAAGSSYSTAKEARHELTVADAKRTALIGEIDLRLVPGRDSLHGRPAGLLARADEVIGRVRRIAVVRLDLGSCSASRGPTQNANGS